MLRYGLELEIKPYPPAQKACTLGDNLKKPSNTASAFADYAMKRMASPERIPGSTDAAKASAVQERLVIDAAHQYMAQYTNRTVVKNDLILPFSSTSVVIECKVHHWSGYTTKEPLTFLQTSSSADSC